MSRIITADWSVQEEDPVIEPIAAEIRSDSIENRLNTRQKHIMKFDHATSSTITVRITTSSSITKCDEPKKNDMISSITDNFVKVITSLTKPKVRQAAEPRFPFAAVITAVKGISGLADLAGGILGIGGGGDSQSKTCHTDGRRNEHESRKTESSTLSVTDELNHPSLQPRERHHHPSSVQRVNSSVPNEPSETDPR